jgi:CIC family chloride channel protein
MRMRAPIQINVNTVTAPGGRFRVLSERLLGRFGLGDEAFLLLMAVVIGTVTGAFAVGFHELITFIRDHLYQLPGEAAFLYGNGKWLLVILPAAGGLAVGLISRYVFRTREGHGVVDVMESVMRSSGFQKPSTAIEKILTSALTLGSGGSAGAEGPIVQIGAAIASGIGQLFRVARTQMPILTGCGCAAGISAIFHAPFGGVLFTLEVILQDFSIRSFTPVVLASVIAQVTAQATFQYFGNDYSAIFAAPTALVGGNPSALLNWEQVGNFILLGIMCGCIGTLFIRQMHFWDAKFHKLHVVKAIRPAIGGALVGLMGLLYIVASRGHKPFDYGLYPMPAFFGDGYGIIHQLLRPQFFDSVTAWTTGLLLTICLVKIVATGITLGSGGSGGVIAPCLFIGATLGAILGHLLELTGWFHHIQPEMYALVGMGAVLAAVVHAPMASILICFELTQDYKVMLPAMLACIIAVAVARLFHPDSIYTQSLRSRGLLSGTAGDFSVLRRVTVEQVSLEPVSVVTPSDPVQRLLDLSALTSSYDFVVSDESGKYAGMVLATELNPVLMDRDAVPVLVVGDVMRRDIEIVRTTDDLGVVFDAFSRYDVSHLPVCVPQRPDHVIGLISRTAVIRRYQEALKEA